MLHIDLNHSRCTFTLSRECPGLVPDLSYSYSLDLGLWTGLFWGRGLTAGLLSPMSWSCPCFWVMSGTWPQTIFFQAKFVRQNKIIFLQSFLLNPASVLVNIIMVCVSTGANCMVWVTKKYVCPLKSRTCLVPVLYPLASTMGTALVPDLSQTCPGHVPDMSSCPSFSWIFWRGTQDIPD